MRIEFEGGVNEKLSNKTHCSYVGLEKKTMHIGGLICNQSSRCYRIVWRVLIVTKFIALILLLPDRYSEEMVAKH